MVCSAAHQTRYSTSGSSRQFDPQTAVQQCCRSSLSIQHQVCTHMKPARLPLIVPEECMASHDAIRTNARWQGTERALCTDGDQLSSPPEPMWAASRCTCHAESGRISWSCRADMMEAMLYLPIWSAGSAARPTHGPGHTFPVVGLHVCLHRVESAQPAACTQTLQSSSAASQALLGKLTHPVTRPPEQR